MIRNKNGFVLEPNEGDYLVFQGISTRIKVRSEQTNGAWTLIESTMEPHFMGFKQHTHQRIVENFYILEGTVRFCLDEREMDVTAGALVVVKPGMWHTYSNPFDAPAKYLLYIAPGGMEKFLEGIAESLRAEREGRGATDPAKLRALAEQYDATI